ncbi:hypothetical protein [Flavobacterium sp.]|uniref:hypothetical protein n=1 Tax=Flavobacterium sp. TaxID=239 RepID=UPI002FDB1BAF
MKSKVIVSEYRWLFISLFIAVILVFVLKNYVKVVDDNLISFQSFFGLSNFPEILIYFTFSTFVVFGIKGFLERYSQKTSNLIIIVSGLLLILMLCILSYQILFEI